ncbi:hypothetical protein [Synergistes jonesii]|uniref:Uncharacterized protein n=2 Tax=Synergistes jonesii TaxID=2754 RepID=A0A073J368_9BACT|nr:hypothetical protein [Synergistes jonesii]KEJ92162.1 hypothetical protein EH55_05345 [Synergistes jonesii]
MANENLISHRRHLWAEGAVLGATGEILNNESMRLSYIHSDFFPIESGAAYTFRSLGPCKGFLVFFDADKVYLGVRAPNLAAQQQEGGYTFTSPNGAAWFRVTSSVRDSNDTLLRSTIYDLGYKHLYKLEKGSAATSFIPSKRDSQEPVYLESSERPKNNAEAARQLVSVAESYLGRGWVYGQEPSRQDTYTLEGPPAESLVTEAGIKQIDCMTLAVLAINGIDYFQSKYFNSSFPWRGARYYGWGKYPNHLYLEGLSRWFYKNGWEIDPGINYSKLQAGDLVFWGGNPLKPSYAQFSPYFRCIDHVGIYTGRWVPDPNRNNELHPQTIEVQMGSPVVVHRFVDEYSDDTVVTSHSTQWIQMFARIPLETPFTEYDSEQTTGNVIYSSYYRPSLFFEGNGLPFKIDIYGRNYAIWEIGNINPETGQKITAANRIRSEFVPIGTNYKNGNALSAAGFTNVAYYFYTADLTYLGYNHAEGEMYSIITFKKTDNSNITSADLATFNEITAIQKAGRDTRWGAKYPPGFHSYAYLDTVLPTGSYLDRRNGKYAYTSDGITWTELPAIDQAKLNGLRIGDGENNIYVPNGQKVKLMKQEW